ncbi:bifunctional metallophosphatase/5'-nucleotidase [Treponema pedis]|uniref:Phosphatase/nucleotidase n=1 Tax=Treponema pedis str. T A4 TaxID=1291379 RepID=S6A320_9SPIR|nr:5'-nucleotidase C-terminal domain-containing protein [Treponema pedis]AGT43156.1 phosphatase/nucleotidase [Treponema pedis str. T A4]
MMKKKFLHVFAALIFVFSLVACVETKSAVKSNELSSKREAKAMGEQSEQVNLTHKIIEKGAAGAENVTITIGATGDVHGRLYSYEYAVCEEVQGSGFVKIFTLAQALRKENPNAILIDVGDTVQDNSAELFNDLETHPMVQAMNYMNFDVWVLGNHEFNFEKEFISRNIRNFNGAVLSANIKNKKDGSYFVLPYQLFNVEGVRVAVVGLLPPHIPMWEASSPSHFKGLEFEEPIDIARKTVNELKGKYDVLIGAFHLGRNGEHGSNSGVVEIAKQIPEFDLIFGGHEHARYANEVEGMNGDKTWIIEPGCYGWALAVGEVKVKKEDGKWKIVSVKAENRETAKIVADKQMEKEFKFVHDKSVNDANLIIGKVTDDFISRVDYITGNEKVTTMPTIQLEDTALIDLINDVQLYYTKADISSAAAFRSEMNLKKGDFKKKDVAFIYKYSNTLMGINITGENLLKYMEWSASYYNTSKKGDVTISFNPEVRSYNYDMFEGVTYDIDISKEAGNRIKNVKLNGKDIEPKKRYKLAVNNYRFGTLQKLNLASEKDVYYDSYKVMQDSGRIRDLIVKYVQEVTKGTITPKTNFNWKITGFDTDVEGREKILADIKSGKIKIPKSADGRTPNVKSINVSDFNK